MTHVCRPWDRPGALADVELSVPGKPQGCRTETRRHCTQFARLYRLTVVHGDDVMRACIYSPNSLGSPVSISHFPLIHHAFPSCENHAEEADTVASRCGATFGGRYTEVTIFTLLRWLWQ